MLIINFNGPFISNLFFNMTATESKIVWPECLARMSLWKLNSRGSIMMNAMGSMKNATGSMENASDSMKNASDSMKNASDSMKNDTDTMNNKRDRMLNGSSSMKNERNKITHAYGKKKKFPGEL